MEKLKQLSNLNQITIPARNLVISNNQENQKYIPVYRKQLPTRYMLEIP